MNYRYVLQDGTNGHLDKIFIDNSQVITNMISSCDDCIEIPILKDNITGNDIKNVTMLLEYLLKKTDITKEQIDQVVNEENLHNVEGMIVLSEYCDIEITLNYLLKYVAELIRRSGSVENLRKLFETNYKKLKLFGGCK